MDCLIGIKGRDFVLLACDNESARSILTMKKDTDKTFKLNDRLLMAVSGEPGDAIQFAEYIAKNVQLYRMRNGYDLSVKGAVNFTRRNLADSLRSRGPYNVNMLLGGYDDQDGANLYYMDYLASSVNVPFGVHGYGSYFSLSILDKFYKPDLSAEDAKELATKCINEIATRMVLNLGTYQVKVIDKDGIRDFGIITPVAIKGPTVAEMSRGQGAGAQLHTGQPQPIRMAMA